MKLDKRDLLLYAVTDRSWLGGETLAAAVEKALQGGATIIQLREKELAPQLFLEEARVIKEVCRKYGVPFIVNDNVDVALAADADGVHVGQKDMEAGRVRRLIGAGKILGVSADTVELALAAQAAGADYLGVGAMFPTGTKLDASAVSFETAKAICEAVSIPVVAIGGITKQNMMQLRGTGVDGVALVSAIFASGDIEAECKQLRALARKMVDA